MQEHELFAALRDLEAQFGEFKAQMQAEMHRLWEELNDIQQNIKPSHKAPPSRKEVTTE